MPGCHGPGVMATTGTRTGRRGHPPSHPAACGTAITGGAGTPPLWWPWHRAWRSHSPGHHGTHGSKAGSRLFPRLPPLQPPWQPVCAILLCWGPRSVAPREPRGSRDGPRLWLGPGQAAVEGAAWDGDGGPKTRRRALRGTHPTSRSTVPGALPAGHTFPCLYRSAAFFLVYQPPVPPFSR